MMISQLIVHDQQSDHPVLAVVANPDSRAPITFQQGDESCYVPRLGSQDLIRLAFFASRHGWEIDRFELEDDVTHNDLDEERGDEVSGILLAVLHDGTWSDVVHQLVDDYPTFSVVGVEFVRDDHRAVIVRRDGVTFAEEGISPLEVLEPAWQQLQLA